MNDIPCIVRLGEENIGRFSLSGNKKCYLVKIALFFKSIYLRKKTFPKVRISLLVLLSGIRGSGVLYER